MTDTGWKSSVKVQLAEAASICLAALSEPGMKGLMDGVRVAPLEASGWFELLNNYPAAREIALIQQIKDALNPAGGAGFPSVERYAVLQALTVALPRVNGLPVAGSIKRKFAELAVQVARPSEHWLRHFAAARRELVEPMAELATLRQYPAGELIFNYNRRISFMWPLRFPPRAVPGFLLEAAFGLKGVGPMMCPHINRWRPNPLFVRKLETERSFWRMAQTLMYRRDVKFLLGDSWLYSAAVAQVSPHLTWLRTIYEDAGAYVVDMEAAHAEAGFKEASGKRAELFGSGAFSPRRTLVFWRRDDMLAWAARRMDLADEGESVPAIPAARRFNVRIPSPRPARHARYNSPLHLWNALGLMLRRPRFYLLLVLILPAFVLALALKALAGMPVLLAFAAAIVAAWLFQYYFFQ